MVPRRVALAITIAGLAACSPKAAKTEALAAPVAEAPAAKPLPPLPPPPVFAFLPADTPPELRTQFEKSAWVQRVNSAEGWVILKRIRSEYLKNPDRNARKVARGNCPDEVKLYPEAPDKVVMVQLNDTMWRIGPGHVQAVGQRNWLLDCAKAERPAPFAGLFDTPPVEGELKSGESVDVGLSVYLKSSEFGLQPVTRTTQIGTITTRLDFSFIEKDPSLSPGAKFIVGYDRQQREETGHTYLSHEAYLKSCTLLDWITVGEGDDALPFQAAHLSCKDKRTSSFVERARETFQSSSSEFSHEFWMIPELGWAMDKDFVTLAGGWKLTKEGPGRWWFTGGGFTSDMGKDGPSLLFLSPEAAADYYAHPSPAK